MKESPAKEADSAGKEDKAATAPAGDDAAAAAADGKEKGEEGDKPELEEGEVPPTPPTAKQVRVGRKLGLGFRVFPNTHVSRRVPTIVIHQRCV